MKNKTVKRLRKLAILNDMLDNYAHGYYLYNKVNDFININNDENSNQWGLEEDYNPLRAIFKVFKINKEDQSKLEQSLNHKAWELIQKKDKIDVFKNEFIIRGQKEFLIYLEKT